MEEDHGFGGCARSMLVIGQPDPWGGCDHMPGIRCWGGLGRDGRRIADITNQRYTSARSP